MALNGLGDEGYFGGAMYPQKQQQCAVTLSNNSGSLRTLRVWA